MEEVSRMGRVPRRATALVAGLTLVGGLAACSPQPNAPTIDTLSTNVQAYAISGNWNPVTSTYLNTYFAPQQAPYETSSGSTARPSSSSRSSPSPTRSATTSGRWTSRS
jgi:hypothetical protein